MSKSVQKQALTADQLFQLLEFGYDSLPEDDSTPYEDSTADDMLNKAVRFVNTIVHIVGVKIPTDVQLPLP